MSACPKYQVCHYKLGKVKIKVRSQSWINTFQPVSCDLGPISETLLMGDLFQSVLNFEFLTTSITMINLILSHSLKSMSCALTTRNWKRMPR